MSLKYRCPNCGTSLGYEGLCWKCKAEKDREDVLRWTQEQILEKQKSLMQNIEVLEDFHEPEFTDFWNLLGYRGAITSEIQRAALSAKVFFPVKFTIMHQKM